MGQRKIGEILARNQAEMRILEGNLLSAVGDRMVKSIFVTSSRRTEGTTTSAALLALALAKTTEREVLLVDANLTNPSLRGTFQLDPGPGLTDFILLGQAEAQCVRSTEYKHLSVMTRGANLPGSADLFSTKLFSEKLIRLKSLYDYVIFDGEAVLPSSNACVLARQADGVIFVLECERTKWELLQAATEKVTSVGGIILGVIMNKRRYYVPRFLYNRI